MPITSADIYTGFWTNWSSGSVLGATVTVPSNTGTVVTAVVAIYVQLVAGHIWNLMAYVIHRIRDRDTVRVSFAKQKRT